MKKPSPFCPQRCPDSVLKLMLYLDVPMASTFFSTRQTTLGEGKSKDKSLFAFRLQRLLLPCSGSACIRLRVNRLGSKSHTVGPAVPVAASRQRHTPRTAGLLRVHGT